MEEENKESIVDTTSKTYKIVGIIGRPATNIEYYSAPGYTFITYLDENKINGIVDVYTRFSKDGVKNSYETIANILGVDAKLFKKVNDNEKQASNKELKEYSNQMNKSKYSDININSYLIALEANPILNSGIGGLSIVVGIVIGIIVFTSIFCIKNSFDISITEKIKQYGMLRSIGATKRQIKRNVLNINFLVQSLLKLSKFDANTVHFVKQENDLKTIVEESIKNVSTLCDLRNINIKLNIKENSKIICDDKWQIEALTNIIKNAIEHSKNNSNIIINIENNNVYSMIEVIDFGEGIAKKDIKHIFERFYKCKNTKTDSIGIGLALAKTIIEEDKGTISVESNKLETKFIIKYYKI